MDPPQLIDRDVVYRGKMITVHHDTIRQPDGSTAESRVQVGRSPTIRRSSTSITGVSRHYA